MLEDSSAGAAGGVWIVNIGSMQGHVLDSVGWGYDSSAYFKMQ